ncbi:MAG: hypothetical protein Q4D96_11970 [Propionibacteriaceae bacterium]|nr:hypothetical protein [Propionibacteriaceae bacterium]
MELVVAWYDTAPILPDESVKYLGEVLNEKGMPLQEMVLTKARNGLRGYSANTPIGRVGAAVDNNGWSVLFSPPGTRRFITMWDWEEWVLGKPRPNNSELSTADSVEWVLGLLEKGEPVVLDLEVVEKAGEELDRRVARDRWLTPLLFLGGYIIAIGLFVSFLHSGLTMTAIGSVTLLGNLLIMTFKPVYLRIRRKFEGRQ